VSGGIVSPRVSLNDRSGMMDGGSTSFWAKANDVGFDAFSNASLKSENES
jgi:hypothetical protein